jgi:hypothetical protein
VARFAEGLEKLKECVLQDGEDLQSSTEGGQEVGSLSAQHSGRRISVSLHLSLMQVSQNYSETLTQKE